MTTPTPTPTSTSTSTLDAAVQSKPYWYHRIELPGGIVTPGWAPLSVDAYRVPDDLTGLRVLDIGAWDGFWTFEALKRGAREAVAIDDFSDYLGMLENKDRTAWENFDLCRDALGYSHDVCQRHEMSVYDICEETLGRFDMVFFFGTAYHLRHPLLALDNISAICDTELFVESAILDDFSPYRGGIGKGYGQGEFVAEFYPTNEYGNNQSNWWAPTLHCLGAMVAAAGFPSVKGWKLTQEPTELGHCRGFIYGSKQAQEEQEEQPDPTGDAE